MATRKPRKKVPTPEALKKAVEQAEAAHLEKPTVETQRLLYEARAALPEGER